MHNIQFSPASQLAFRDITVEKAEVLGPCSRFIRVRSCRLWPAEWGGISHPHWVGKELPQYLRSHFGEVKTPRSFWLKAQFQDTHTKKLKSHIPEASEAVGCRGTMSWMMSSPLSQAWTKQERESRVASTYYLPGVGVEVSNFSRAQLWMVILKVKKKEKVKMRPQQDY